MSSEVQIAVIDQQDTQIVLAVPGVQGATGSNLPTGGTANQVLRKASSTNYDTDWSLVTNAMVDSSAAIAGTKISPNFGSQNVTTTGTATAAALIPSGSSVPTNGVYLPSANNVAISSSGTGRLFVTSDGKIGVAGTPFNPLDVFGSATLGIRYKSSGNYAGIVVDNTSSTGGGYFGCYQNGTQKALFGLTGAFLGDTSADAGVFAETGQAIRFFTNGSASEKARITDDGKLGLGTSSPSFLLDVNSGSTASAGRFLSTSTTSYSATSYNGGSARLTLYGGSATGSFTGTQYSHGGNVETFFGVVQNSSGLGDFVFQGFNGSAYAERLRINSSGNVGIGVTSPSQSLHVVGAIASTGQAPALTPSSTFFDYITSLNTGRFSAVGNTTGTAAPILFSQYSSDGSVGRDALAIDPSGRVGIGTTTIRGTSLLDARGDISFGSNASYYGLLSYNAGTGHLESTSGDGGFKWIRASGSATSMVLDSSGRLLVGTSSVLSSAYYGSAKAKLQIAEDLLAGIQIFNATSIGLDYPSVLELSRSRGTTASPSVVTADDQLGIVVFSGYSGAASNRLTAATIKGEVDGTPDSGGDTTDMPGRLVFSTTADGASSPTERMRITRTGEHAMFSASGTYTVNSYNASAAGTESVLFQGSHSATGPFTGTQSFVVYTNGNVQNTNGSYGTISDEKLKENIIDANSQWADLKAIKIRNWNFKEETGHGTHRQIGPIAQELENVCPGLVFEVPDRDEDGNETGEVTKGVNQSVLYMKAVKALQEAMERIETLEAKVAALEAQ